MLFFFRADWKTKIATLVLYRLRHFRLLWNSPKLDRKQDLNVIYQVCVFWPIGKPKWPPWPMIGWDIFDFFSETADRNSRKHYEKQDLNVLYQVCVLGPIIISMFHSEMKYSDARLWISYYMRMSPADSSRVPGLTSGLSGSVNVHRGALLLVPQWQCISSFAFYSYYQCRCYCINYCLHRILHEHTKT